MPAYRTSTSSKKTTDVKKAFCRHCFNLGKDESTYTSHYTKESTLPNAKVICPEILNNVCNLCSKKGHLASTCSVTKSRSKFDKELERENKREEYRNKEKVIENKNKNNKNQNRFSNAFNDSDDESDNENIKQKKPSRNTKIVEEVKEEFPSLSNVTTTQKTTAPNLWATKISFAKIAEKAQEEIPSHKFVKKEEKPMKKYVILVPKTISQNKYDNDDEYAFGEESYQKQKDDIDYDDYGDEDDEDYYNGEDDDIDLNSKYHNQRNTRDDDW